MYRVKEYTTHSTVSLAKTNNLPLYYKTNRGVTFSMIIIFFKINTRYYDLQEKNKQQLFFLAFIMYLAN